MNMKEMLAPVIAKGARSGARRASFKGVTIHNTGNGKQGAGALNHGVYLQGGGAKVQASWHYAVDDKLITRSIPEKEKAWHAADGVYGTGNSCTVAIEICMNPDSDIKKATDNAAELTADILRRNGVKQAEGYVFQHNHWSGKNCPQMIRAGKPYDWVTFLAKVNSYLKTPQLKPPHWAEKHLNSLVKKGLINSPEVHRSNLDTTMSKGEIFAMLDRISDIK